MRKSMTCDWGTSKRVGGLGYGSVGTPGRIRTTVAHSPSSSYPCCSFVRAGNQQLMVGRGRFLLRASVSLHVFRKQPTFHAALYTTTAVASFNSKCGAFKRSVDSSQLANRGDSCTPYLNAIYDNNFQMGQLGRRGDVNAARQLFDRMPERDKASYASMISIYLKHNEFHKAETLFCEIPQGMRSIVADSTMVHAYAKAGAMDKARDMFDKMPQRNAFSWTSLISGYFKMGKVDYALEFLERMPEREKNEITWTNVILGLGRNGLIDRARDVFDHMPVKNVVTWTSMIKLYIENNLIDEAFELFHVMPQPNLHSWNIMVCGLLDNMRVSQAKELFDSMPLRNAVSWTIMVTGLARNGMIELARNYFDQMPYKDVSAWNAMISAYIDEGRISEASEVFNLMPGRNTVSWNAIIDGYAKNQQDDEAFRHFVLMLRSCVRPNESSLTSLLTSCKSILGVLQAHGLIIHLGLEAETTLSNTLITLYYRVGDLSSSQLAFNYLEAKDVVTWTAIILAYSNHGFGVEALQAFAQMLRSGHNPDEITFLGVLSACTHAGLVKKGLMLFESIKFYGLEPLPEHYSCLIDILGRAGLVDEAMSILYEMPADKHDGVVLGTLLSSCNLHGDDGLVDQMADELLEFEPDSSGGYVLLAKMYAASGKWNKFSEVRKKMRERGVRKEPGFSQIEVNGKSHVFLVGDKLHREMKDIYMMLKERVLPIMHDTGYEIPSYLCNVL